jgi:hypothetical protein
MLTEMPSRGRLFPETGRRVCVADPSARIFSPRPFIAAALAVIAAAVALLLSVGGHGRRDGVAGGGPPVAAQTGAAAEPQDSAASRDRIAAAVACGALRILPRPTRLSRRPSRPNLPPSRRSRCRLPIRRRRPSANR